MLNLRKCPRCGARAFEKLKTYGQCFECNFNSVEGFSWGDKEGRIAKELYNAAEDQEDVKWTDEEILNFEDQEPPDAA